MKLRKGLGRVGEWGKGRELIQVTRLESWGEGKGEGAHPGDQAGELGWVKGKRGGSLSR